MNTTPVTPKTHPVGTRFIADSATSGLYELTILEWTKNGNVKVHFHGSNTEGWLSADKLPNSVEILVQGKNEEIKLEELQETFGKFFERIKTAGSGVLNEVCDAANDFLTDLTGTVDKSPKKEEKKDSAKK